MDELNNEHTHQSKTVGDVLSLITRQVVNGKSVLIYNSTSSVNSNKNVPTQKIVNTQCNFQPSISPQIVRNVIQPKVARSKKMLFT
jgi:hypothetical protein